jgi:dTDP-4-amino-4,6-dideoxygalactose transaminase
MSSAGIGVGVHYRSLPQQPYYQERYGWRPEDFPAATAFGDETVSLPLGPGLSDSDVDRVIDTVTSILRP